MAPSQYTIVRLAGLVVSMSLLSLPAQAEPQRSVLISGGQASQSSGDLQSQLQGMGYTNVTVTYDKKANAWSLGFRHPINTHWSTDIQYLQQGKATPQLQATLPLGKTQAQAAQDAAEAMPKRGQGISAVALYHYPLNTRKLTLQAGLGAFLWRSERTATVGTTSHTSKSDGISPIVQLGMNYPLTNKVQLEAHWQHTFMPDEDVDRLGIGLAVGF